MSETNGPESSDAPILIERIGEIAVVTLNRPDARNAVNVALAKGIVDAMAACADARAIVLTGNGSAFCAGLDLRNLGHVSAFIFSYEAHKKGVEFLQRYLN